MQLLLRKSNAHARLTGKPEWHSGEHYTILDGEVEAGWIQPTRLAGNKWVWQWAINTRGHFLEDSGGNEETLEDAKQAFKQRYEQVKQTKG